jgi:hypothetical protein
MKLFESFLIFLLVNRDKYHYHIIKSYGIELENNKDNQI